MFLVGLSSVVFVVIVFFNMVLIFCLDLVLCVMVILLKLLNLGKWFLEFVLFVKCFRLNNIRVILFNWKIVICLFMLVGDVCYFSFL